MSLYRKKPVVIEAQQLTDTTMWEVFHWCDADEWCWDSPSDSLPERYILIKTLEGDMKAQEGDFIIKGVSGEFYPCKPDIFALTYEAVSED